MKKCTFELPFFCSLHVVFLAFLWSASLICGVYLGGKYQSVVFLMRLSPFYQVSIVGLIFVLILPVFIAIISTHCYGWIAIYIISLVRGIWSGCTLSITAAAFHTGAWLICLLVHFSEMILNLVLLWYLFRRAINRNDHSRKDAIIMSVSALLIGAVDYFIISPFAVTLIYKI